MGELIILALLWYVFLNGVLKIVNDWTILIKLIIQYYKIKKIEKK